ncbi:Endospore coat-associated protein YheD [compost metagenome]|uniref:YheC/YheD family protein n=1 Tax=Paenibacillus rhizolycopersici TaxID=2780073 RepID=A0ABS2HCF8_9BACL|nr:MULTISPECIES: YheC/YheD family protein [Paenibacillus]MBM6997521.1 YheC/YheD family protein [Paenibacillus rhizolycopersici]MUG87478.1 YheC/YheD family protein [Paenibacillus timonensis]GIP47126.1 endospore coat-associated protein YheD [Paenibacillus sp. J53TS2]
MSLTFCNVHFTQAPERVVYVSGALMKNLKLSGKKSLHLRLGGERVPATIKRINKAGKHLYLASGVRRGIKIPKPGGVYLRSLQEGEVQIGPLIGVLSDGPVSSQTNPFGSRTGFIKQLLRQGSKISYIFAFTPRDIHWEDDTVTGYFLNEAGRFTRKRVPLPDVVYNRLPSRRAETTSSINQLRERFVRRKIPFFNWSFFNKSDIYRLLEKDTSVVRYVPESIMSPTPEQIKEMLDRHSLVYYKPNSGSLGNGIYRLSYIPRSGYYARYRKNGRNALLRFSSFASLMRTLQARHGRALRGYVAQQGIRLIEIDSCPIDFRFHMHKNGRNQWVVVGIGAKKAGKGSVTTHLKNGGSLLTPDQALSRAFGARADEVLRNAKSVAITLAEAIESHQQHLIGEIGFDIGIDREEKIWMFEANAKPGRSIFKHPSLRAEGKASVDHILDHCLYLSKFRRRDGS